jgi:hypothetical protein
MGENLKTLLSNSWFSIPRIPTWYRVGIARSGWAFKKPTKVALITGRYKICISEPFAMAPCGSGAGSSCRTYPQRSRKSNRDRISNGRLSGDMTDRDDDDTIQCYSGPMSCENVVVTGMRTCVQGKYIGRMDISQRSRILILDNFRNIY